MDLDPHPLVSAVVEGFDERQVPLTSFDDLADLAAPDAIAPPAQASKKRGDPKPKASAEPAEPDEPTKVARRQRALQYAGTPSVPPLVTFTGFVGATLRRAPGVEDFWTVLYLDPQLSTWLLIPKKDIVARDRITDEKAPYKQHDVIWVNANSSVGDGSGSLSVEAQFLTGEFTRAGDFEASANGGTMAAATGVFCPGGCKPKTPKS
jgi:hypothetical protein